MMSNSQFEIIPLACNHETHEGCEIVALCLNEDCLYESAVCSMCMQIGHNLCDDCFEPVENIPELIEQYFHVKTDITLLVDEDEQLRKEKKKEKKENTEKNNSLQILVDSIEYILHPVTKYLENPNLTNLNHLGQYLKEENKVNEMISQSFERYKRRIILLNSFNSLEFPTDNVKMIQFINEIIEEGDSIQYIDYEYEINECTFYYDWALQMDKNKSSIFVKKGMMSYIFPGNAILYLFQLPKLRKTSFTKIKKLFNYSIINRKQQLQESIKCFDQAIMLDPDASLRMLKGDALRYSNEYTEALNSYEQAILLDPFIYNQLDQLDEFVNFLEEAIKRDPKCFSAWKFKGYQLFKEEKYLEAIKCFEEAIQLNKEQVDSWIIKGWALCILHKYYEGLNCFENLIEMNPGLYDSWIGKGWALYFLKQYKEAIDYFDQGIQINEIRADSWIGKGWALYHLNEYQDAIDCFNRVNQETDEYCFLPWRIKGWDVLFIRKYQIMFLFIKQIDKDLTDIWNGTGWILYQKNQFDEAIQFLDQALQINPECFIAWKLKGLSLYQQQKYEEAFICFEESLKLSPEVFNPEEGKGITILFLGWALYKQKQYDEAIKYLEKTILFNPIYSLEFENQIEDYIAAFNQLGIPNHLLLGLVLYQKERYQEAINYFNHAIQLNHKYNCTEENENHFRKKSQKELLAIAYIDLEFKLNPKLYIDLFFNATNPWNGKGWALLSLNQYEEALYCFNQSIKESPNKPDALEGIGIIIVYFQDGFYDNKLNNSIIYHQKQYKQAINFFQKAEKNKSDTSSLIIGWGWALFELQKYEKATVWFKEVIDFQTNKYISTDFQTNKYTGKKIFYLNIYKYYRHNQLVNWFADSWNGKGQSLYIYEKYDEAIQCFNQAIKIDAKNAELWNSKGSALYSLQKFQEAINCFDISINLNPTISNALNGKGWALYRLKEYEEAIKYFDRAIKIDTKYFLAWNGKGIISLILGWALQNLKQNIEAMQCFEQAIKINQKQPPSWNGKGWVLYNLNEFQEAIYSFDEAIKIDSNYYPAWNGKGRQYIYLGWALQKLNQLQEAQNYFEQVIMIKKYALERKNGIRIYILAQALKEISKIEEIEYPLPTCNYPDHEGNLIESLCFRVECKYQSAACCKCMLQFHSDCVKKKSCKSVNVIPLLLRPYQQIQSILLQKGIDQEVIRSIEIILKPIDTYIENPNLKNLNQLCVFKKQEEEIQIVIIEAVEDYQSLVEQISKVYADN